MSGPATEIDRSLRNQQILEAVKAGAKYSTIAEQFGLDRSSISNIAIKAGIKQLMGRRIPNIPRSLYPWYRDLICKGWRRSEAAQIIHDHARARGITQ